MLLIYGFLLLFITMGVVISSAVQQRKRRKQVIWFVDWIHHLRLLLELIPKHRGMANALLKGDESFRPLLVNLQKETDTQLQRMNQLVMRSDQASAQTLFVPIERQWREIRERVVTLPAKKSFAMHTRLIATVIERMEDDSIELEAFAYGFGEVRALIAMLTRELPQIMESIGQARGIGTGVVAQRRSTVANRVNLKFLHGKASSIIDNKLVPLRSVMRQFQGMEAVIDDAVSSARKFLNLLRTELIDTHSATLSPEEFYKQGTNAITASLQLFDQLFPRCVQSMGLR